MRKHQIMKWIFYLCLVSIFINGTIYMATKSGDSLISLLSAAGLGVIMGIGALLTRKS
ncbi:hypothetical protein [Paenibacillus lentus]|uniref:hypothetical protein n=1 Tax=Paenibacillus lentus TaxID=1338368 RepID=UPI0013DE7969|nr:hypothetical protein [Paenibacillus lentus]